MSDEIKKSDSAPKAEAKSETTDLPKVESPPLSPAGEVTDLPAPEPIAPEIEEKIMAKPAPWRLRMKARQRHHAVLAASVTIAACVGAIVGALATSGINAPKADTAALRDRAALEQSVSKLNREIATLKANVEAGSKSAHSQIAKLSDKITERLQQTSEPETTGSIPTPPALVPTPQPRPDIRASIVHDWTIHDVTRGYVSVQRGPNGDIYQVVIGAVLPGLGPVERIKRENGRWSVVTPHGTIVSMADRRFFEQ